MIPSEVKTNACESLYDYISIKGQELSVFDGYRKGEQIKEEIACAKMALEWLEQQEVEP